MKKFFKKIGYSIGKIEKYAEMSTEGTKSAIKYIAGLLIFITLITCLSTVYRAYKAVGEISNYIEANIPDFTYKDGKLSMESEEPIEKDNLIIDVKDKTDEEIQEYQNKLKEKGDGVLVLKDKIILVYAQFDSNVTYALSDIANQLQVQEIKKDNLLNYLRGSDMISIYAGLFFMIFIYAFMTYFVNALWIALVISAVGYIVAILLKVRMRFKAIFNMGVYALTLSVILQTIYATINMFTTFEITYFEVMYIAVAFIYLVAAIFLTRIDLIKTQEELTKVKEVQKQVKEEEKKQEEKKEEKDKEKNKESKKDNKKESGKKEKNKKQRKEENGGEPEGSNV